MTITLKLYPILISQCFGSNPSCWQFENLKHLRNLKKWHKFIKRSQILLRFEYNIHWGLKPYWTLSAVWIGRLIKTEQIDGTYKDGLEKYFQHKKERHAINHFNLLFRVYHVCYTLTYCYWFTRRCVEWVRSFLKYFQKGGGGYCDFEVVMIFYVFFISRELHSNNIFFQHFLYLTSI